MSQTLFTLIGCMLWSCQFNTPNSNSTTDSKAKFKTNNVTQYNTTPWLWTSGYLNFNDSISTSDLIKNNQTVYVLKGTESNALEIEPKIKIKAITLNEFKSKYYSSGCLFLPIDSITVELKVLVSDSLYFFKDYKRWKWFQKGNLAFNFTESVTKFTHTGVTALTRATGSCIDKVGIEGFISNIKSYFQTSDYVHISNEVSIDSNCFFKPGMSFCSKSTHFELFKALHVNVVELTGNHNKDYGATTFIKTYEWYLTHGIKPFGGGRNETESAQPLILNLKGGEKLALIGFNESCPSGECSKNTVPGAQRYSEQNAKLIISDLKSKGVNFIMVGVQFNESDHYQPLPKQIEIAKKLIDLGADMVYGSQAHVIQHVEFYKNKIIYYGLGNFLFDQIHSRGVRQAMFMDHYFYKGRIVGTKHWYTFMQENRIPSLAPYLEKKHIQSQIWLPNLLCK